MTAPTPTPKASARVYYPLFDGIDPEGQDQRIRALDMSLEIGGEKADLATNYQVSIYGRRQVDTPNLITIFRKVVERADALVLPLGVDAIKQRVIDPGGCLG